MAKYQIVLVLVGIALIGWLYSLPKVNVKNKKQQVASQPQSSSSVHENADSSAHTISSENLSSIRDFRIQMIAATDDATKIKFADSLSSVYKRSNRFDSAAFYKAIVAELSPILKNLESAGDIYREAANFAVNPAKASDYSQKARGYYEQILKEKPEELNIKGKLAMTYISTENPMAGIKMLREVIEKDPSNELAIFNLGILSIQSKQYEKAIPRFEKLISMNTNNWKARFYLGVSYKELGEKEKAKEQFLLVKKLEKDPEVVSVTDNYLEEISR